ncbi:hypothetical protein HQQ94_16675 [Shewanella sp. VB17]|uniref:hypothetical protein n=1 Tax=Shewanella sp. VB17 TaxID=2739432 RepID=UPI0015632647|nr:hypothetical protein [Shewanella sp. VB17]NRD74823.1 hypothetical protein [Shewanella sp. VB17]
MNNILFENDYILSVGAGKNQLPLIKAIKKYGYKVISCDKNPEAEGKSISNIFLNISSHEPENIIIELGLLNVKPKAVLTRSTGIPVVTCAIIADSFNLSALDIATSKLLIHKNKFTTNNNKLNIPSPKLFCKEHLQDISFPVFIKPAYTVVSHAAMSVCHKFDDLAPAIASAKAVSTDGSVNIEEYLIGNDIASIDFVQNKKIQHLVSIGEISTGAPHFDGLGWYTLDRTTSDIASSSFATLKHKLNLSHGFFQTAMKYNSIEKTAKIYEIHAEIGGDLVNDVFIPHITNGYDIFKNNISLSLNEKLDSCTKVIKFAIILFRKKIKQYNLSIPKHTYVQAVEHKDYLTFDFNSQKDLNKYLYNLTSQKNVSITNREN